ncbi:MAG: hypothetical protein IPO40_00335 [Fibrobacteres bacterium]|nr:hypothetical protein [Fibrobacterota bacterium]
MASRIGHWRLRAGLFLLLALLGPMHGVLERWLGSCTVAAMECGELFEQARELDDHSHPDCHAEPSILCGSGAQAREAQSPLPSVPGTPGAVPQHREPFVPVVAGRSSPFPPCQGFFREKVGLQLYA